MPWLRARRAAARMAAFMPGASPPEERIPIFLNLAIIMKPPAADHTAVKIFRYGDLYIFSVRRAARRFFVRHNKNPRA
jgi:hypothetical protein